MTRGAVALGGNRGPVAQTFCHALHILRQRGVSLVAQAGLYDTTPVGAPDDGQRYLNSACLVETRLSPGSCWTNCSGSNRKWAGCGESTGAPARSTSI